MLSLLAAMVMVFSKVSEFSLSEVQLLDSPFKKAMDLNGQVLLKLEPDRLLHNTRKYAGLQPKGEIYGGWEAVGIAGHTLGHYLTALSLHYKATGDKRFRDRVANIVKEMGECQVRYGDGYIGALPPVELKTLRDLKSGHVDLNGGFNFKSGAWVPWYTQHKVLAGLKDAWLVAGVEEAKFVTLKLADWVDEVTKYLSSVDIQKMLGVEHGGMLETLVDLSAATGDKKYLDVSRRFYHEAILDPLASNKDVLVGQHANTQIPKVIGAMRNFEVTGDKNGLATAKNFWNLVVNKYSFAIGGNSDREHFFPTAEAGKHLSPQTAESCNTYNMLRLTEHLIQNDPQAAYGDYYERALYNHILATQDPATGMYAYFMSLKPGHFRTFSTLDKSFWCCFGTGMENHTKYGEAIYFHGESDLFVNLYIPSRLNWVAKGLVLTMKTDYPRLERVSFVVEKAPKSAIGMNLRIPAWCTGAKVLVNGKSAGVKAEPGTYAVVRREWKKGDRVELTLPMSVRTESLMGDSSKVAFLYGPLVLAGDFGPAQDQIQADQVSNQFKPAAEVPVLIAEKAGDLVKKLKRAPGLVWTMTNGSVLRPYLDLAHEKTAVYWDVMSQAEFDKVQAQRKKQEEEAREEAARTLDSFQPGEQQSEVDHGLQSFKSFSGEHQGRKWRDARDDGWFSFTLKTDPAKAMVLRMTYWGGDVRRRFNLLVEGVSIARVDLNNDHPDEFFKASYPIPADVTKGKSRVTIRVECVDGRVAGGIFGAEMMLSKRPE